MLKRKIVTRIPLTSIWKDNTEIQATRSQYLAKSEVENILKKQSVTFVIANIGNDLNWIETNNCNEFWDNELQSHLVENYDEFDLNEFENNYCYVASEWIDNGGNVLIILEMFH